MKILQKIGHPLLLKAATSVLCFGLAGAACADQAANGELLLGPWSANAPQQAQLGLLLAQAASKAEARPAGGKTPRPDTAGEAPEAPWYGRNNMHKYLGLGSLGAAALTMIAPKTEGGAHEFFANAAAALGGAAIASGAYSHWGDLDFTWEDPDTKHALFGVLGTLGFLAAVAKGGESGHAAAGSLGALSMIAAIKYEW